MKRLTKKLAIVILVIISIVMLIKVIFPENQVIALTAEEEMERLEEDGSALGDVADFLLGVLLLLPKAMIMAFASILRLLVYSITSLTGDGIESVDQILFNDTLITSINFFDIAPSTDNQSFINTIRINVSEWYYVLRNLSIVILLGILLYVGIRMAISTIASEEAKYKKMFKDWVVSLALVFVLQYIMIFTIEVNNVLVDILGKARVSGEAAEYVSALDAISSNVWDLSVTSGFTSALVYTILVGVTILFLIMYIKRMLTVGFLIVISPLITITYSIDKMGDGKSQALNTWLKEFVFNVLIQPFHCVIYLVFTSTAINLLGETKTLGGAILSVCMILFIFKGEKIVKDIFNFRAGSLGEAIGGAAAIATGMSLLQKKGEKDKKKEVKTSKIPTMDTPGQQNSASTGNRQQGNPVMQGGAQENLQEGSQGVAQNSAQEALQEGQAPSSYVPVPSTASSGPKHFRRTRNLINKAKGKVSSAVNGAEKLYGKLPSPARKYIAASAKLATLGTMAALGAATGSGKGIMSGIYAGNAMNQGASARVSSRKANKLVMENESKFAGAYQNYLANNDQGITSHEQMAAYTQHLLEHGDPSKMDSKTLEYYGYARKMQQTYGVTGEENLADRMQETLGLVAKGDITPPKIEKKKSK